MTCGRRRTHGHGNLRWPCSTRTDHTMPHISNGKTRRGRRARNTYCERIRRWCSVVVGQRAAETIEKMAPNVPRALRTKKIVKTLRDRETAEDSHAGNISVQVYVSRPRRDETNGKPDWGSRAGHTAGGGRRVASRNVSMTPAGRWWTHASVTIYGATVKTGREKSVKTRFRCGKRD